MRVSSGGSFDAAGVAFSGTEAAYGDVGAGRSRVFEMGLGRLSRTVDDATRGRGARWLDRVRAGLVAFLGFLDDEPGWGVLLCSVSPVEQEIVVLRREQRVLGVLTGLLDDGVPQVVGELSCGAPLTAELVAGGVLAVVRERLSSGDGARLVELAPSLMAFIAVRYLGQAAASAELSGVAAHTHTVMNSPRSDDRGLPVRVTRRTVMVLRAISRVPCASNREIARTAGLRDEGQSSRLLGRLQKRGLIQNVGAGAQRGEPNAWLLTAEGRRMLQLTSGMARVNRLTRGDVAGEGRAA